MSDLRFFRRSCAEPLHRLAEMRKSSGENRATFAANGPNTAKIGVIIPSTPTGEGAMGFSSSGNHHPPATHHGSSHTPAIITHSLSQPVKRVSSGHNDGSNTLSPPANLSPPQGTPSLEATSPPPSSKKDFTKVLKRSNTSTVFPKKESFSDKDKKIKELNLELEREKLRVMQHDMMNQQTKAQIQKFDKTIQSRRKIFGNPSLAKEEKTKRRQHHLQMVNDQKDKKKVLHKLESTDEYSMTELQPFPSVTTVITSSTTSFLFAEQHTKKYSSLREIQSPFGSKAHRPLAIYGTKHFYEEDYDNKGNDSYDEQDGAAQNASAFGEAGFVDDDEEEDEESDIFASSEQTDEPGSPMSFKRSGTIKFMDDLLRADSRSTLLEPSLSMAETAPYDGNPNVANYFGEEARKRFFMLFNRYDIFNIL